MYNEAEISLIKQSFAENDSLLKLMRKLFFGYELTEEEAKLIKATFKSKELVEIVRRKIYGKVNVDGQIGAANDFWLGAESQIFGAQRDTIIQTVESKSKVLAMFERAMELLVEPNGEKVSIAYDPASLESDPLQTGLIARNLYIKALETALFTIKSIAGQKSESLDDTLKRIKKDSAR